MLKDEHSLAQNVKDKTVRKNVMSALDKITQHLKLFKTTPKNGLMIFCGNVSTKPGVADIKLWSLEPPQKLSVKVYRCDQVFILNPLKEMVREKEVYGLIVLDAREADIGLIKGKSIESLKHLESTVPSKTVKGGMSQKRYDKLRENALHDFFKKIGENSSQIFLKEPELKGIIVGGPGPNKQNFAEGGYLHYEVQKKLLGVKDTSYTGDYGLRELVNRSEGILAKASIVKEMYLLEKFFGELQKGGKIVYGYNETLKALEMGVVETLLISEDFDWVRAKLKCECGFSVAKELPKEKIKEQKCEKCDKTLEVEEEKQLIDILVEKAKNLGTKVEFISTDTREGVQFKELGGIGAFLRFMLS